MQHIGNCQCVFINKNGSKNFSLPLLSDYNISLELGVFFVILNYIYLVFPPIHAVFYFNYIHYSGLLIFCCQNVATEVNRIALIYLINLQQICNRPFAFLKILPYYGLPLTYLILLNPF